jgi:hypothetical protein
MVKKDRGKTDTPNAYIHERSRSSLGIDKSLKVAGLD